MNKKFLNAVLFGALLASSTGTFTSCKDYDDDINRLDKEISNVKDVIKTLEDKVGSGKYVESCTPFTDGNGGYEIKFTDGQTVKIYNGAKGETGAPGAPGTPGAPGSAATDYVVSVTTGETAYELIITYADGTKKIITMPKATSSVSGIKFVPTYLSEGEAARIHFPTIVTDSIPTGIGEADYSNDNFSKFAIVYSGKGELKYQVNPHSVSFDNFEVVGFVRDTAEIWNYSTGDKKWMLFDKGETHYSGGKLTKAASYAEGHGIISFRAKDWAFAEQTNWNERTVYSFRLKNGDNIIHSDFVPAKHEVILQKNVHLVKIADSFDQATAAGQVKTAIAPNKTNYREFIGDTYYRKTVNPAGTEEEKLAKYQANKTAIENNVENQWYKGNNESKNDPNRIVVELAYTGEGHTVPLKDIVTAYFDKRAGKSQTAQYPLMDNGFDDYSLVFEPVDFYYDGVNQTKRYLDVKSDGTVTVKQTPDDIWGDKVTDGDHTAAIDRTPIVRVKLVAPGEDNGNVVKTAIIKIRIVRKTVVPEINITETKEVTLKHINQNLDMDMDKIFNHKDVQMSKDQFRKTYVFYPEYTTATDAKKHAVYTWDAKDNADYSMSSITAHEYNQVFVTVQNTAFSRHDDHDVYTVKGIYKPNAANAGLPDINVTYTINVNYPTVVAPDKTQLNWVNNKYIAAHGRYDNFDAPTTYEMVSILNESFDLINYNPYKGQTNDKDWARATLSFELVGEHNNASNVPDGDDSGIRLYQGADKKWYIALEATDKGRKWINAANTKEADLTKIKMRAVVSFNEDIDGLYGTCNKDANAHNKYAKQAINNYSCADVNTINGTPWTEDVHVTTYADGDVAPETGRSKVVIDEFEIAFITPMVFHEGKVGDLHDKYQEAENTVSLKEAFFLSDYLWSEGGQEQFNKNHVIYDYVNRTTNTTLDATSGWSKKLVVNNNVFDVQRPVNFKVVKATYADGTSLDAENMKKIKLDNANQTITWINNGQDIANPFTIEVEVCVNHKWGGFCDHTDWKNGLGHSVGIVKIAVKKYNDK